MILAPTNTNPIPVLSVSFRLSVLLFLWLFLSSLYIAPATSMTMAQNPHLARKRSLAEEALCSANQTDMLGQGVQQASKKLRRLPHVFSRVLELPIKSDANVLIENNSSCFRFVLGVSESLSLCGEGRRVSARLLQVYPGVVKVVLRGDGRDDDEKLRMEGLELDRWRFRLPATTRPERATAVCVDGKLVVTVPKDLSRVDGDGVETEAWSGVERLVEIL